MSRAIGKPSALALLFLGLSAGSARADEVLVKVPFPFVVGAVTLPAGQYLLQPFEQDPSAMMIRGMTGDHPSGAIVLTIPADEQDPAGERPALTFKRVENQYRLSTIWESETEGRTLVRP